MQNNIYSLVVLLIISGCAGILDQPEYQPAREPSTSTSAQNKGLKCNAGEVLVCETRSPIESVMVDTEERIKERKNVIVSRNLT